MVEAKRHLVESITKGEFLSYSTFDHSKYPNANVYSIFPKISENSPKEHVKDQKVCIVCKSKVGDLGVIDKKKYICMFCSNAVCKGCSPLKCYHPQTLKQEKTCMQCYFQTIESRVKSELRSEVDQQYGDLDMRKVKISLDNEVKDYEIEIKTLEIHSEGALEEIERLKHVKKKIDEEKHMRIREAHEKLNEEMHRLKEGIVRMKEDIKVRKEIAESQQSEIEKSEKEFKENMDKIQKIQKKIEAERSRQGTNNVLTDPKNSPEKLVLIEELHKLKTLIEQLQNEQTELKKLLADKIKQKNN